MKTALVLGGGGFVGHHLVKRLKSEGYWVRAVDIKRPPFEPSQANEFFYADLRHSLHPFIYEIHRKHELKNRGFDEIYQLAADMGGAGYVFTGEHDAEILRNSAQINLNVLEYQRGWKKHPKLFYSSSACVYKNLDIKDAQSHKMLHLASGRVLEELPHWCREQDAYPADPDSDYGFEKLFSERLYQAYARTYGLDVRIARFHNIFGELGAWNNGREKSPAAICRKVAQATDTIEIWGTGQQTRSFLHVEHCVEGIRRLMQSGCTDVLNIGSSETVTIDQLVDMVCEIAGKQLTKVHVPGPVGVQGRSSDNTLIQQKLGWVPPADMRPGLEKTYAWIAAQVKNLPGEARSYVRKQSGSHEIILGNRLTPSA